MKLSLTISRTKQHRTLLFYSTQYLLDTSTDRFLLHNIQNNLFYSFAFLKSSKLELRKVSFSHLTRPKHDYFTTLTLKSRFDGKLLGYAILLLYLLIHIADIRTRSSAPQEQNLWQFIQDCLIMHALLHFSLNNEKHFCQHIARYSHK